MQKCVLHLKVNAHALLYKDQWTVIAGVRLFVLNQVKNIGPIFYKELNLYPALLVILDITQKTRGEKYSNNIHGYNRALCKRIRLHSAQHRSYYAAIALTTSAQRLYQH